MQIKQCKIEELKENPNNPRTISEYMLNVLAKSLLAFPRMLETRPIVVNEDMMALGGNQRLKSLKKILQYDEDEIKKILTDAKKTEYLKFWKEFKKTHTIKVYIADDLTEFQQRDFVVKDNKYYGENDNAKLMLMIDDKLYTEWTGIDNSQLTVFDSAMNDENVTTKLEKVNSIKFANNSLKLILTNEEYDFLCEELTKYKQKNGTNLFFIKHLLSL